MKRVLMWLPVFLVLWSATTGLAQEGWLELNSSNLYLIGQTDEKKIKDVAQNLESFHQKVQTSFRKIQFQTPFQTNIIIVKSSSPYLIPNKYFFATEDANYIIVADENNDPATFQQIFHDYALFLFNNNLGQSKIPAWLNLGLAEYFSRSDKNEESLISQNNNFLPLPILLETDYYSLQNQPEERKAIFKAQALAFLSFLILEKGEGRFERIEIFIEQILDKKNVREALFSNFGVDLKKVEGEFRQFLKQPRLAISEEFHSKQIPRQNSVSTISESRSLALLGEFLLNTNRLKEAAELLLKSLQIDQKQTLALNNFGLLKAKQFYYDEAEQMVEKSIQIEPENFRNYYRYALTLSQRGMTEFGFVSGYSRHLAEKMREALKKAIVLNPEFTEAYALLCFVNFVRNENLDESLDLIRKALKKVPGNQKYLLRLSEIYLRKENFTEARKLAFEVFRTAPNEQIKLYSQNTIQRIDSTEYQLERIRSEKAKYVNDDIVTEKPLSEDEIKRLREKATIDQIKVVLKRPKIDESRIMATLTRIECEKGKVEFFFKTQTGLLKLQAKSFDGINLLSFIEEMSDFRLGCGDITKENNASVIFRKEKETAKTGELISIEFVPKIFKLQN